MSDISMYDCDLETMYTLEAAKNAALEVVRTCSPGSVQSLLDIMREDGYDLDDLNRRAVLYLLDDGLIVIHRENGHTVIRR